MADFIPAYEAMILNEGGYRLTTVRGDRGGPTYAGIARARHPGWPGWRMLDRGEQPTADSVREFYRAGWWQPLRCDDINSQQVAASIFDFAVNSSAYGRPTVAAKLAQIVAGATPDGVIGPKTIAAINAIAPPLFLAAYALAKLARYRDIVTRDPGQRKFLLGWINRILKESAS